MPLRVTLGVQGVSEQVQVSGEAPVARAEAAGDLDQRHERRSCRTFRARAIPWVVLQTVPGVIVDRVNVGGSESGQQSNYIAKGATTGDNTWYMDGIPITDMSALGSSPSYYDFDMFQEMQVTTGGTDARQATPGVQMNFVLKSGTNTPHGSARTYYENKDLQGDNLPDDLVESLGGASGKGNRINKYADYGGELGGPLVRDRLWGWGSFGRTDVNIQTLAGVPDKTTLTDIARQGPGGVHPGAARQLHVLQRQQAEGRPRRRPVQPARDDLDPGRPVEDVQGGDRLRRVELAVPDRARRARQRAVHADAEGRASTTARSSSTATACTTTATCSARNDRPQIVFNGDGNWFRGRHEVRFGASARDYNDEHVTRYAGDFLDIEIDPDGTTIAIPIRPYHQVNRAIYTSLYAGDTCRLDRLTLNGSLRFDRATSSVDAITVAAHPVVPDVLPGVSAPAIKNAVVWNTLSPRAGLRVRVRRGTQDDRARQLLGVCQPAAGADRRQHLGRELRLRLLPGGRRQPQLQHRAGELRRFLFAKNILPDDPTEPGRTRSIRTTARRARTKSTFGVDRELFANFGDLGGLHLAPLREPVVERGAADRRDQRRLRRRRSPHRQPARRDALRRAVLRAARERRADRRRHADREPRRATTIPSTASRSPRPSGCRTAGWDASGSRGTASREYFDDPSKSIVDPTPLTADPQVNGGLVTVPTAGSGKSQIYLTLPTLPVHRQRLLPGAVGRELRRQLRPAPGLQRRCSSRTTSAPTIRSTRPRTSW